MEYIAYEDHHKRMNGTPVIYHRDRVAASERWGVNWHENIEVILMRSGEGRVLCDDRVIAVRAQEAVVINAQVIHTFLSDSEMIYDCFIFNREDIAKNGLDTNYVRFCDFVGRDEELIRRLDRVQAAVTDKEVFLPEINAAVLETVLYLYAHCRVQAAVKPEDANEPIRKALLFLNENWNRTVTMDEVASCAGLSKYHFMRRFKTATGKTPLTYLQEKRCRTAEVLLHQHRYSVGEIARMVGFDTPSYFSKVFLSVTGKSPSQV